MEIKSPGPALKRENIEKIIIYIVFGFYLFLLMKILFLSRLNSRGIFSEQEYVMRSVNLIPFSGIIDYIAAAKRGTAGLSFANVVGNIIIFVPLGAYLALFRKEAGVVKVLFFVFLSSLGTEIIQWSFAIGSADVDDIILNSLGGLIGILGYKILLFLFKSEKKAQTTATAISVLGFPAIFYYLFIINMRF